LIEDIHDYLPKLFAIDQQRTVAFTQPKHLRVADQTLFAIDRQRTSVLTKQKHLRGWLTKTAFVVGRPSTEDPKITINHYFLTSLGFRRLMMDNLRFYPTTVFVLGEPDTLGG
jgi:hypothetical protein